MATNPMQRKARNSFLFGMLITLLITGTIIALLAMQLIQRIQEDRQEQASSLNVYVLTQDVKSGQVITPDMMEPRNVKKDYVPNNANSDSTVLENYALQDKEGNDISTRYDSEGNATLYIDKNGLKQIYQEENGNYYILTGNSTSTNNGTQNSTTPDANAEKEYIELNTVPIVAKIDMNANTVITTDMISKSTNPMRDDLRKQEYNMFILPTQLQTGDYVDIRLALPSGQDYIVVAKKEVEIPQIGIEDSADTVIMDLTEDEIVTLSNAIVEAYKINGSKLYLSLYTEAGMQEAATPTYPVNNAVYDLINRDNNIVNIAKQGLYDRYNNNRASRDSGIESALSSAGDEAQSNLEEKMEESITNQKTTRQEYLDSLSGTSTEE